MRRPGGIMMISSGVLLLPKALFGGLVAAILMWIVILSFSMWRLSANKKRLGIEGLGAVAGGWSYLLHSPTVVVAIAIAFGLGFYWATRP